MTDLWHEPRLLIDGELCEAEGGRTYPVINPATEDEIARSADASTADMERAIGSARRAFDETDWATDHDRRLRCLRQLHTALVDNLEELRALVVAEVGAPVMLTSGPMLEAPVAMTAWYADLLEGYEWTEDLGEREMMGRTSRRWVEREAIGVVAAITPYNYPIQISLAKLAPALAAGCTVVLKAAPDTPLSVLALGRLVHDHTDIPPGVVNVIAAESNDVSELLTAHRGVDMVSFTGSTPVGRAIMKAASETVKKTFLELGGKSAFIVLDDADPALAAMFAAFTICSHAGQGCAITTRLLVPAAMHDEVVASAAGVLGGIAFGDPTDASMMMGPLINARQRDKVDRLVQTAVAEGATIARGGSRPDAPEKGFFYEPTLLAGVGENDTIAQQEVFGPVLAVIPYEGGDEEAVRIANNSEFGLSGAVFGEDIERCRAVARGIRSGTISINGGMYYGPDAPFGGYKQSGIGREMGVAGFEEFLEIKTIAEPVVEAG
ncbi:MAG: aldehyde dehydrogenase family protein [Acidimicrobiales bacterium]|nr:aldehyde dehydrogenase family protein [Acidimicrobiales bacterium]